MMSAGVIAGKRGARRVGMRARSAEAVVVLAIVGSLAGCVSVHVGQGDPNAERTYVNAMSGPGQALTAAARSANDACAGGGHPVPATCYANTQKEIAAVQSLQAALRSVPTPARFAKANTDLLQGLELFAQGLAERNQGLAARSSAGYQTGQDLITKALALQKAAFAEYPSDSGITM
jgi:hypothetical protein